MRCVAPGKQKGGGRQYRRPTAKRARTSKYRIELNTLIVIRAEALLLSQHDPQTSTVVAPPVGAVAPLSVSCKVARACLEELA
jgi:hypothetical protein